MRQARRTPGKQAMGQRLREAAMLVMAPIAITLGPVVSCGLMLLQLAACR